MNDLDNAMNLVDSLQKALASLKYNNELKLNKTEIDRLHALVYDKPNRIATIKAIPTGMGTAVMVHFDDGSSHDISDYESW